MAKYLWCATGPPRRRISHQLLNEEWLRWPIPHPRGFEKGGCDPTYHGFVAAAGGDPSPSRRLRTRRRSGDPASSTDSMLWNGVPQ